MSALKGCGCCDCLSGAGQTTEVINRPGLSAIGYRVGTYATFRDAMIRRLTVPIVAEGPGARYSLHSLTTREADDPAIALLDAWAVVADVLTFYQERIANESYLRTATERRSILELGRLVGYTLKPGVAASVYLAYTLEDTAKTVIPAGSKSQSIPPAGQQPQMFETSEDTEARGAWNALLPRLSRPQEITLENVLTIDSIWIKGTTTLLDKRDPLLFVFEGSAKSTEDAQTFYAIRRVLQTVIDTDRDRTEVVLETVRPYYKALYATVRKAIEALPVDMSKVPTPPPAKSKKKKKVKAPVVTPDDLADLQLLMEQVLLGVPKSRLQDDSFTGRYDGFEEVFKALIAEDDPDPIVITEVQTPQTVNDLVAPLLLARGITPASQWEFSRSLDRALSAKSDFVPRLLTTFFPRLGETLYTAVANVGMARPHAQFRSVHVLRRRASVFGYNAPGIFFEQRPTGTIANQSLPEVEPVAERTDVVHLDSGDTVTVGSYVVAQHYSDPTARFESKGLVQPLDQIPFAHVATVTESESVTRSAYGISGKSAKLTLKGAWATETVDTVPNDKGDARTAVLDNLSIIRNATILTGSEALELAQLPVDRPIGKPADKGNPKSEAPTRIELDTVVDGLTAGKWIIVTGERLDTAGTTGVVSAEVAMIDNVEQVTKVGAGGTTYSVLNLAPDGLAYQYKRSTVTILGNVVQATHGESRAEIAGGGDASKALQTFTLRQTPLTFVSAPTVAGVVSTLAVRVNDVLWHETGSLADAGPNDRVFVSSIADDGKVTVTFGNGREGSRLPTGNDNVRATYRSGIGIGGNAGASTITTAISRPLGVKGVTNPIAASGGADPESRDDARRNIPVSLQALGRVVSVRDYADFARTFAGIAKAVAVVLTDGRRRIVHLTVGGTGDIEIDTDSDLYRNLVESLRKYGDPFQPFIVAPREKIVIAGAARIAVHPDYLWSSVAPNVRAALLDTFSYDRRDFGQPVYPAEVIAAIQRVAGVSYVDLDALVGLRQEHLLGAAEPKEGLHPIVPRPARRRGRRAAQIAYLPPEVADLFILTEITNV